MTPTVPLPNVDALVSDILDSLDDVARMDRWTHKNPTSTICVALTERLASYKEGIECASDRARSKHEDEREFLFDFSAVICESINTDEERCTVQLVVAGEIEFRSGLNRDFEKLMYADALVCFFVFPDWVREHRPSSEIDFFSSIAERRVRHVASRGTTPPPVFIIASYSDEHRRFTTRVIRYENH